MCALSNDAAFIEHDDLIRMKNRTDALRHDQYRASAHLFMQRLAQGAVRFVIECGKTVVENQDFRPGRNRAMDKRCFCPPETLVPPCAISAL